VLVKGTRIVPRFSSWCPCVREGHRLARAGAGVGPCWGGLDDGPSCCWRGGGANPANYPVPERHIPRPNNFRRPTAAGIQRPGLQPSPRLARLPTGRTFEMGDCRVAVGVGGKCSVSVCAGRPAGWWEWKSLTVKGQPPTSAPSHAFSPVRVVGRVAALETKRWQGYA